MQNRAAVMYGTHDVRLEDVPVPEPGPREVLVEIRAVGVCGSDVHYYDHGRIGAYVVAAWLAGIIVNLLILGDYYDVALRDFGLMLGALALARLARRYDPVAPPR